MTVVLGDNQYGKSETRIVRITRGAAAHDIKDLNVSIALTGDFAAAHLEGDNSNIVPTDTQKNTVYAFAGDAPMGEIEDFGLRLARHFVNEFEPVTRARVTIEEYAWTRVDPHAFVRQGAEKRLAMITCTREGEWVIAGLGDLVVLKSSGSEFHGYLKDRYTTLPETRDRILATSVTARWRYSAADGDWKRRFDAARAHLVETFARKHSLSLQQTLYAMGESVLNAMPEVAEIRMSMPNKHHLTVDLAPFGVPNRNEVFCASDRPYGLIEGTVLRDDAPDAGFAW